MFDDPNGKDSGSTYVFAALRDCNDNGTLDSCDITSGTSKDDNGNGIPDECETCTGNEKMKKPKCKQRQGGIKMTVKLINGTPGDMFSVRLSSGQNKEGTVKDNGKGKAKFKNMPSGSGSATATWRCGAEVRRDYSCP